jgi:hypothetical protein
MSQPNPKSGVTEWWWFRYSASVWQVVGVSRINERIVNVFFTGAARPVRIESLDQFGAEWGGCIDPPKQ